MGHENLDLEPRIWVAFQPGPPPWLRKIQKNMIDTCIIAIGLAK